MRRVVFVASIETTLRLFVTPLASDLAAAGIECIAAAGGTTGNLPGFARTYSLPPFRRGSPSAMLAAFWSLGRVIDAERPDLLHLHTPPALVLGRIAARVRHVSSIAVAHGSFLEPPGARSVAYGTIETLLGRLSAATVTENEEDAAFYRRFLSRPSVSVAPVGGIGVDLARVRAARERPAPAQGSPAIVVVGRLTPEKNLDVIVRAFQKFREGKPSAGLRFVGSALPGDAPWQVPDVAGITHVPWVDDPYPLIAGSDLMVVASRREGFSMAAAESLLLGTPVVAVANRGVRQLIRCGANGLITVADDAEKVAQAMTKALDTTARVAPDSRLATSWSQESAIRFQKAVILRTLNVPTGNVASDMSRPAQDS